MFSIPAAFVLGVVGIIFDKRKWLAVVTTVIAGLLVAWYVVMIGASIFLHR
jgi:fatty-acid desaturase